MIVSLCIHASHELLGLSRSASVTKTSCVSVFSAQRTACWMSAPSVLAIWGDSSAQRGTHGSQNRVERERFLDNHLASAVNPEHHDEEQGLNDPNRLAFHIESARVKLGIRKVLRLAEREKERQREGGKGEGSDPQASRGCAVRHDAD